MMKKAYFLPWRGNAVTGHNKSPIDSKGSKRVRIVVLSGAGIAAESGIPTFRDDETGFWSNYDPRELASLDGWLKNPDRVWTWYLWRHHLAKKVQPNDGHLALIHRWVLGRGGDFACAT